MATSQRGGAGRSAGALARAAGQSAARQSAERRAAVEEASRPQASPRAEILYVWDTTAAPGAIRTHEVIVRKDKRGQILTKSYGLSADKGCAMPAQHALQFLRDDAFVVSSVEDAETRDENRIRPVKARTDQVNVIALSENETIAEWAELSDDALVRRAMAFPADRKPEMDATRGELIAFLTEASKVKKDYADRLADEGELQGMGSDELDGLFGGDRRKGLDKDLIPGGTKIRPPRQAQ